MIASYEEFAAEHRAEHRNPFNRWCAVVENSLAIVGVVAMLSGRRKAGLALVGAGSAMGGVGHAIEGNLPRALRDLAHPIWSVRADMAVARATIMGKPVHP
jgi:hypothetical protein